MKSKQKKILIIEDEKQLATALELKMKKEGYQVAVAHDGKNALELMEHDVYDIALLDLMMPIMDGFSVLKAAQKIPSAPVFIVLSNLTQPDDVSRCLELGARKFLIKSETPLAKIVEEVENL